MGKSWPAGSGGKPRAGKDWKGCSWDGAVGSTLETCICFEKPLSVTIPSKQDWRSLKGFLGCFYSPPLSSLPCNSIYYFLVLCRV